jgi:hypothetical protein
MKYATWKESDIGQLRLGPTYRDFKKLRYLMRPKSCTVAVADNGIRLVASRSTLKNMILKVEQEVINGTGRLGIVPMGILNS